MSFEKHILKLLNSTKKVICIVSNQKNLVSPITLDWRGRGKTLLCEWNKCGLSVVSAQRKQWEMSFCSIRQRVSRYLCSKCSIIVASLLDERCSDASPCTHTAFTIQGYKHTLSCKRIMAQNQILLLKQKKNIKHLQLQIHCDCSNPNKTLSACSGDVRFATICVLFPQTLSANCDLTTNDVCYQLEARTVCNCLKVLRCQALTEELTAALIITESNVVW